MFTNSKKVGGTFVIPTCHVQGVFGVCVAVVYGGTTKREFLPPQFLSRKAAITAGTKLAEEIRRGL